LHVIPNGDGGEGRIDDFDEPDDANNAPDPDDPDAPDDEPAPEPVRQYERYLRLRNTTDDTLTVSIQYRTYDEDEGWIWLPDDPEVSDEAITVELDPGDATYVDLGDGDYLHASRIRIWATGGQNNKKYMTYAEKDLWLVPEEGDEDDMANEDHWYEALRMGTFTFTFK
jgi:hypothetical protein